MNKHVFAIVLILLPSEAFADDNLHPEDSMWARETSEDVEYVAVLKQALPEAFTPDVQARMIAENYGYPEDAIGLRKTDHGYEVFSSRSADWLWVFTTEGTRQRKEYKFDLSLSTPKDVKIDRCRIVIGPALAGQILDVWKKMLLDTRYYEYPHMGQDGAMYHFAYMANYDDFIGQIWSPEHDERSRVLVSIAYDMDDFCRKDDTETLAKLSRDVDALLARMK